MPARSPPPPPPAEPSSSTSRTRARRSPSSTCWPRTACGSSVKSKTSARASPATWWSWPGRELLHRVQAGHGGRRNPLRLRRHAAPAGQAVSADRAELQKHGRHTCTPPTSRTRPSSWSPAPRNSPRPSPPGTTPRPANSTRGPHALGTHRTGGRVLRRPGPDPRRPRSRPGTGRGMDRLAPGREGPVAAGRRLHRHDRRGTHLHRGQDGRRHRGALQPHPGAELHADKLANGAKELLDEVATGKVTGEEEIWSHTDLWDFQANVDGARIAYEDLKPLLAENDAELDASLETKFAALQELLDRYRVGDGFELYNELSRGADPGAERRRRFPERAPVQADRRGCEVGACSAAHDRGRSRESGHTGTRRRAASAAAACSRRPGPAALGVAAGAAGPSPGRDAAAKPPTTSCPSTARTRPGSPRGPGPHATAAFDVTATTRPAHFPAARTGPRPPSDDRRPGDRRDGATGAPTTLRPRTPARRRTCTAAT